MEWWETDRASNVQIENSVTGSNLGLHSDVSKANAVKDGLRVVEPKANELFLDIDCNEDFLFFSNIMLDVLRQKYAVLGVTWSKSRNKPEGKHVVIVLERNIDLTERILLQACLGSDRKRELLSWFRVLNGDSTPTMFFEVDQERKAA